MGDVVARSTQPALGAIKLAWWRERLEELDEGKVPAEPRLQAAFSNLLPRGISGSDLSQLEQSWALMLNSDDFNVRMRGVASHGPVLFGLAARLLRIPVDAFIDDAANSFVSIDLGRRGIFDVPGQRLRRSQSRAPRRARPLTSLGALARRDMKQGGPPFEPEGTPARAWTVLRHWITGRI